MKVLNIQQLWQTNCCCEHTHTNVFHRRSRLWAAPKCQGLADQFLLWAYICVFLNTHMSGAKQVHGSFDHFKNDTHVLQKMSTEGWPTKCCCEHTHTCDLQNHPMMKPSEGYEHSVGRPTAAASTHTHVFCPRVKGWPTNCCCGHAHVCVSD